MATTILGKVSVTPKGAWSSGTAYEVLDIVSNSGSSYIAKRSVPADTALSNTDYWLKIASKGDAGYAPTVTVTPITGGHEVSITDAVQTQTFDVMDGQDGSVTSVAGKTGAVTLDADDVAYDDSDTYTSGTVGAELTDLKSTFEEFPTGIYPDLTVGNVMSESSATEDQTPYLYRISGGGVEVGKVEADTIVGGSVVWNQMAGLSSDEYDLYSCSFAEASGEITLTVTGSGTLVRKATFKKMVIGHKYFLSGDVAMIDTGTDYTANLAWMSAQNANNKLVATTSGTTYVHGESVISFTEGSLGIRIRPNNVAENTRAKFKNIQCVDLTAMFGTAVADYIYTLEQGSAGAGVAWFRKLFPKDYYAYNAGELLSVEGLQSHDMVGFNQWDEEWESGAIVNGVPTANSSSIRSKNFTPCLPNTTYFVQSPRSIILWWYDANKNWLGTYNSIGQQSITTAPNAHYFKIGFPTAYGTTYNHDVCINLSWDGERDGEYEPYKKYSYPLDSDLILRGIPKLDANNNLYYDGDIYTADGTVTRKYGIRAYQSGDESLTDAITDMTNTVYKLNTATTEQATPFATPQIVDPYGTEEYVTTGIVPVGHLTKYPTDIVAKVDGLPSDFSTLIAPKEVAMKATRAYTANDFLTVNNVLYRVTTSIASGATLTVGTNVTAVTIADILKALLNA